MGGLVVKGVRGAIRAALRWGLTHDPARPEGLAAPCSLSSSRPGHARCLRRSVVPECARCSSLRHWLSLLDVTSERRFPDHALVLERESLFKESRLGLCNGVLKKICSADIRSSLGWIPSVPGVAPCLCVDCRYRGRNIEETGANGACGKERPIRGGSPLDEGIAHRARPPSHRVFPHSCCQRPKGDVLLPPGDLHPLNFEHNLFLLVSV